jgi:hypothetical protein
VFTSKQIAIGIVAAAGLTAGAAYAYTSQQAPQKHQLRTLGLGVMSVTPATHEARVIVQCGEGEGELVTVKLARQDLAKLTPGATVGAVVLTPDNLVVSMTPAPTACAGAPLEGGAASVTETLPADAANLAEALPSRTPSASTASGALLSRSSVAARPTRTWTFLGKAKRDDFGVLSLDVDSVNLPASYVTQRYLLTDHHARMVLGRGTAIGDLTGHERRFGDARRTACPAGRRCEALTGQRAGPVTLRRGASRRRLAT